MCGIVDVIKSDEYSHLCPEYLGQHLVVEEDAYLQWFKLVRASELNYWYD